uniref:Uncharacterized protein n=1 Tax=Romanomermis culicivorax TaxID=13658 RepID=A0A915KL94_ROMCU
MKRLHSHNHEHRNENHHENHDHDDHDHKPNEQSHLSFLVVLLLSIYALYLLEIVSIMVAKYFKFSHSHGAHSHFGHGGMHANFESAPSKQDTEMGPVKNGGNISQKSTTTETEGRKSSLDHRERAVSTGKELICGELNSAMVWFFINACELKNDKK